MEAALIVSEDLDSTNFYLIPIIRISKEYWKMLNEVNDKFLGNCDITEDESIKLQTLMCLLYPSWGNIEYYVEDLKFKDLEFGIWDQYKIKTGERIRCVEVLKIFHFGQIN